MSGPDGGEEVFRSYNEQGFAKFSRIVRRKRSGKRIAKGSFEAGTCAGMTMLFLRRMIDHGSCTASDVGGNVSIRMTRSTNVTFSPAAHQAAIAQAAYDFDKRGTLADQERRLLESKGLRLVSETPVTIEEGKLRPALRKLVFEPGYYVFRVPSHWMGLVTEVNVAWFFDPDEGCYKWSPPGNFSADLAHYIDEDYEDDRGETARFMKVTTA